MEDLTKYYQVLGLEPGSSLDEVNQAYKDLVLVWHPDRLPQDNDRLQQKAHDKIKAINEARDKLRDISPSTTSSATNSYHGYRSAQSPRDRPPRPHYNYYQHPPRSEPRSESHQKASDSRSQQSSSSQQQRSRYSSYYYQQHRQERAANPYNESSYQQSHSYSSQSSYTYRPPYGRARRPSQPDLSGADLSGMDLKEKDLSGRNLSNANLSHTDMSDGFLHQINLEGANLYKAKLFRANLLEANLRNANLQEANLIGADLSGADLSGADLTGAKMGSGNKWFVKMTGVIMKGTILPDGTKCGT
jgi:curved DNA-binding protein CbpA